MWYLVLCNIQFYIIFNFYKSINYFIEQLKEISNVEFGPKFESSKLIVRLTNLN